MKIVDFRVETISIPLNGTFRTSLRIADKIENMVVKIITDEGNEGYGEGAAVPVITGDTLGSMKYTVENLIFPQLKGIDIQNIEEIMCKLDRCTVGNSCAKAAVDMAVYDLLGQFYKTPVYKLLGGYRNKILTDITISMDNAENMVKASKIAAKEGYKSIKIKVGNNIREDMRRIKSISNAVGNEMGIRIDANQAWKPKEAVKILRKIEDEGINVEFVEQPVAAWDIKGLKYVSDNVLIPVMADESIFSLEDAANIIYNRAADLINIKLMKTGGIHNALKICCMAETFGMECMIGCMLESKIGITAAAHLAAAKSIVTKVDLDSPLFCVKDPVSGGINFNSSSLLISNGNGMGFNSINGVQWNK